MSVTSATQQGSLQRSLSDSDHARGWLATLTLPVATVLESDSCPAALWSDDRSECVFNSAGRRLIGAPARDIRAGADLWLACVDTRDRERFLSAWQSLLSGENTMVCSYRFVPPGTTSKINLEETALRLTDGCSGKAAVLSRYQLRKPRDSSSMRRLVHQIGNNLQSARGEVDLLRLFGGLPQSSFDTIVQAIENIHELTARLDDTDRV